MIWQQGSLRGSQCTKDLVCFVNGWYLLRQRKVFTYLVLPRAALDPLMLIYVDIYILYVVFWYGGAERTLGDGVGGVGLCW
jgi:hypothetical protein